jgi:hypothetical protein
MDHLRERKMLEVPIVSYGDLSLTGGLISIFRFLVRSLKKIRRVREGRKIDKRDHRTNPKK